MYLLQSSADTSETFNDIISAKSGGGVISGETARVFQNLQKAERLRARKGRNKSPSLRADLSLPAEKLPLPVEPSPRRSPHLAAIRLLIVPTYLSSYIESASLICSYELTARISGAEGFRVKNRLQKVSIARRVPMKKSKILSERRAFLQLLVFNSPERVCKWSESRATPGLTVRPPELRKVWKMLSNIGL